MKVVKKYLKVALCFMAFALCSFFMVFAPTITAVAATASITDYSKTINSIKIKKEVDARDGLIVPFLTGSFSSNGYSIKVVDSAGEIHTAKLDASNSLTDNGNGYFEVDASNGVKVPYKSLRSGNYQIVYVVEDGGKQFYSSTYNVYVKNNVYELDFGNALVKSTVKTSSNVSDRIEIPVPSAKIVGDDTTPAVKLDPLTEITVKCNGTTLSLSTEGATTDYIEDNGKYYIQPSLSGATYTIEYNFKRGIVNEQINPITITVKDDFVAPTKLEVSTVPTFNSFELGEKDIKLPNLTAKNEHNDNVDFNVKSIKIEKESDSTIFQTLETGVMVFDMTLEAFQGVNASTDSYGKLKGNYSITYTLVDAYNNECTYTKRIENVTISSKPTIKMVYDYDATGTMEEGNFTTSAEVVNAETELKNKYGYDQIVLPAVYAEDTVSKSDELIVVRCLRNINNSQLYYIDNLKYTDDGILEAVNDGDPGYNYSGDANIGNINKAVRFQFTRDGGSKDANYAGTYQLEYRVIAKNVEKRENSLTVSGSTKYTFTVLSTPIAEYSKTTPTVEITNMAGTHIVDRSKTLKVKFTAKDDDDTRLKNVVYYYYGNQDPINFADKVKTLVGIYNNDTTQHVLTNSNFVYALKCEGYTGLTVAELSENGNSYDVKFETDTSNSNSSASQACVVVVSYNDYGNVSVDYRKVTFKNTDEAEAPTVTIVNTGDFNLDCSALIDPLKAVVDGVITLPTLQYNDNFDKTLLTSVYYYVNSPESESVLNYLSPSKKQCSGLGIVGGEIRINRAGEYVVVYTATDDAGNTTITYFNFTATLVSKPTLVINEEGEDIKVESNNDNNGERVGKTIEAEVGSTIGFNTIVRDLNKNLVVEPIVHVDIEDNGLSYTNSGDKEFSYIFENVGIYKLTFNVTVDDISAIPVQYDVVITPKTLKWLDEFNIPKYADTDSFVYLPDVSASDNALVKVTVTPPSNSKLNEVDGEVVKVTTDNGPFWRFKTNGTQGKYTIQYTATKDDLEIKSELFVIQVGDNVPPTIEYEHKAELSKDIVYDGSNQIQIKFDVKKTGAVSDRYFKITATSNGENIYSYDLGMKITDITDITSNPTPMDWTDLKWEITGDSSVVTKDSDNLYLISGSGTFTIKLSVEDRYGNKSVENITFKVVTKSNAEEKNDTVVGVVLIVISVVVLVGVILFFLFTGKKGGSNKSKKLVKSSKKQLEKVEKEETKQEVVEEVENANTVEEVEDTNNQTTAESVEQTENTQAKEGEIEE